MSVMVEGADQVPWDHDPFLMKTPIGPEILGQFRQVFGLIIQILWVPNFETEKVIINILHTIGN